MMQERIKRIMKKRVNSKSSKGKKTRNIKVSVLIILFVSLMAMCTYYNINITKVSNDSTLKTVTIKEGSLNSIGVTLKENNLIKNVTIFKVHAFLTGKTNLKAGTYELSENMGVGKITNILSGTRGKNSREISITFKEGINVREVARQIEKNTSNSYEDVLALMKDTSYIDSLIEKYWFLTDKIKDSNIYYPLEGYLYPNTYSFTSRDVDIKDIFTKMLDETDRQLTKQKDSIDSNSLDIHNILTLSSIVELEGTKATDRKAVAGVFYNRLNSKTYKTLGSDATTYYAAKIDDWTTSLTNEELNDCNNKYNTRCSSNTGLPVGPICNPSIESIIATLHPEDHNYYYFVADCDGEVYLTENATKHQAIINKLKKEGKWCA